MDGTLTLSQSDERPLTAEALCRSYGSRVCRFAALMTPSPQDAEDLAQDALLRAVRSVRSYDPSRGPLDSWLWRIVANAAKDAAGTRQRVRDLASRIRLGTPRESESVEELVLARLRDR